jgi:hypothetical protein
VSIWVNTTNYRRLKLIIFDEKKYAEDLLRNGYKNIKYITGDNIILVKYWNYLGHSENNIRNMLYDFMTDFQDIYNDAIISYKINKAVEVGMKFELSTNLKIPITENELTKISELNDVNLQRILFAFLVCWKIKGCPSRFKVSNTDIMKLSGIKTNTNVFWDNIYKITKTQMLSMVEYKNKSYYRMNLEEGGDTIITIESADNIVYKYLELIQPETMKKCEECGSPIKITSNRVKYCKECFNKNRKEYQRELMKNKRNVSN